MPEFEYDFFLSHDWGTDSLGRNNHERVAKVNDVLRENGFTTWFDVYELNNDLYAQMSKGIEKSKIVLVFVTKNYTDKVNGDNPMDNCKLEFDHSIRSRQTPNVVPVVMEPGMTSSRDWQGSFGMHLGNKIYLNLTGNVNDPVYMKTKMGELTDLAKKCPSFGGKEFGNSSREQKEEMSKQQRANEAKAARAKSSRGQIKYTVTFTNNSEEDVDLIWKNYQGEEVIVRQGIPPGSSHAECSYFTHPFIARDVVTEQVVYFVKGDIKSVVFEGLNFNAPHNGKIHVSIVN